MYRIDYSQIKKGDTVYIASDDKRNKPYSAKVTSIGRKYITIDKIYLIHSYLSVL